MGKSNSDLLEPVFAAAKMVGLCPLKRIPNADFEKSRWGLVWSLTFGGGIFSFTEYVIINYLFVYTDVIQRIINIIVIQISLLTFALSVLLSYSNSGKIIDLIDELNQIDEELKSIKMLPANVLYNRKKPIFYTACVLIVWLLIAILDILNYFKGFSVKRVGNLLTFTVPPLVIGLLGLQFYTFNVMIEQRFELINDKLKSIAKSARKSTGSGLVNWDGSVRELKLAAETENSMARESNIWTMENLRRIHHKLSSSTKILNSAFSVQLLFIYIRSFIAITEQLYIWVIAIYSENEDQARFKLLAYRGLTFFAECLEIILLAVVCDRTAKEAQKTGKFIFETVNITGNSYHDEKEFEVLQSFCYQLIHHKVQFTAWGIFTLDKPLLYGIVGATTTYLVIVLQFEIAIRN